jgi:NAD dependent epimerase/dehydratase family enzyme
MLLPFKLGLGGSLGSGKQYMPWIALDDVLGAVRFVLGNSKVSGPVNFASPHSVRNADFTKQLAGTLNRPALLRVPAFALRVVLGDAADDMLLSSVRVTSSRLTSFGYEFKCPTLVEAFRQVL